MRCPRSLALVFALTFAASLVVPQERTGEPEPIDLGRTERVRVQLVLLDVTVLDRRDRTVAGLGPDDFDVLLDHRPVELATLDEECSLGALPDPRAGAPSVFAGEAADGRPPRRFVHVFDYLHLELAAQALGDARRALARLAAANEEHMVVALGPGLRVEAPFTRDTSAIDRTLERMARDRSLYDAAYGRLTDFRFYRLLVTLIDLLERVPGYKVVLLYSGPFPDDGFTYDVYFRRIAAVAAKARVSLYPVDAGGIRTPRGFRYGDLGGPRKLARLAAETGGRLTHNTNDLGLGYARAQRDLGCRYTIGFHDRQPRPDRKRRVAVFVRRRGLRVVHPTSYMLRSAERQQQAWVDSALAAPELFPDGGLRVEVQPTAARGSRRWEVRVRVGVPPELWESADPPGWRLTGRVLGASGAKLRSFRRAVEPPQASGAEVSLDEEMVLRPGRYRTRVVLSHPALDAPFASNLEFELPALGEADLPRGSR